MKKLSQNILSIGLFVVLAVIFLAVFDISRKWESEPEAERKTYAVPAQNPRTMVVALQTAGPNPGPGKPLKLQEGHWAGMEAICITDELIKKLKLPPDIKGVLLDEVTLAAAASGFMAGDIVVEINRRPVRDLQEFRESTMAVRDRKSVEVTVDRKRALTKLVLQADILGIAQMESAPMVPAGSIAPHPYRGPCTDCHAIGTTGELTPDPGGIILPPPPIPAGAVPPHRDWGSDCFSCHGLIKQ